MTAIVTTVTLFYFVIPSILVLSSAIGIISLYSAFRRSSTNYYEERDDDECESLIGTRHLRKTSTFYQWNQMPPSSCCSMSIDSFQQGSVTSDEDGDSDVHKENTEEDRRLSFCWEQRRSQLLKKYGATSNIDSNQELINQ